jgi:hypothetical protein
MATDMAGMRIKARTILCIPALLLLLQAPAWCGESASLTRQYAEAKGIEATLVPEDSASSLAAGARILRQRWAAAPDDQEARFGQGLLLFARAIERFG